MTRPMTERRSKILYAQRVRKAERLTDAALACFGGDAPRCSRVIRTWPATGGEWRNLADAAGVNVPSPATVTMVQHRVDARARRVTERGIVRRRTA